MAPYACRVRDSRGDPTNRTQLLELCNKQITRTALTGTCLEKTPEKLARESNDNALWLRARKDDYNDWWKKYLEAG